jgi:hypothetical protein
VFRASDLLLGRDVAVKVFRSVGATDDDASGAGRQEVELQALARLSHPNLITLFDASITEQPPYLVMELVEGPNLAARLATGALPEAEVRAIGAQIADALAYVHAHDMVHRDVKPANILLGTDGISDDGACRARLSDFGIVRLLGSERLTAADFTLGTASYLAPEQARGGDVTPAADVYSLGLVLIEALTGKRSFDGPPVEAVLARLARDPEIPAGLPAPWTPLLRAMTARDPEARPTPAEVSRALRTGATPALPAALGASAAAGVGAGMAAMALGTAADAQATTAIPAPWSRAAAAPAAAPWPAISGPQPVAPEFVDDAQRGRGGRWFLLVALLVMVIVGAACFLAFGSTPSGRTGTGKPADAVPTTTGRHQVSAPHTSAAVANVPAAVVSHPTSSAAPKASQSAAPKASQAKAPVSAAAPTTSAPAPTTSAPPPSSDSAPSASAIPATTEAVAAPPPSSP